MSKKVNHEKKIEKKSLMEQKIYCIVNGCDREASANEYCQLHYIKHWSKIKRSERVEAELRLNKYIEEITKKFPTEYLEIIKKDIEEGKNLRTYIEETDLEENINDTTEDEQRIRDELSVNNISED